jgi:DNA topoisomerase-3
MLSVNGKKGKMLVCQDRECGYKKTVSVLTNSRCPICHKKLELVGEGAGRKFVCVCGHSEKYDNFKERKKKESNKMTKSEVNAYIKKQNKNDMTNNPFADLFDKFDFN